MIDQLLNDEKIISNFREFGIEIIDNSSNSVTFGLLADYVFHVEDKGVLDYLLDDYKYMRYHIILNKHGEKYGLIISRSVKEVDHAGRYTYWSDIKNSDQRFLGIPIYNHGGTFVALDTKEACLKAIETIKDIFKQGGEIAKKNGTLFLSREERERKRGTIALKKFGV